jgi:hypothetical protein
LSTNYIKVKTMQMKKYVDAMLDIWIKYEAV